MKARRSLRLPDYDYSRTGMYFVTICLRDRAPLFGRVEADTIQQSPIGSIVSTEIDNLETRFVTSWRYLDRDARSRPPDRGA